MQSGETGADLGGDERNGWNSGWMDDKALGQVGKMRLGDDVRCWGLVRQFGLDVMNDVDLDLCVGPLVWLI